MNLSLLESEVRSRRFQMSQSGRSFKWTVLKMYGPQISNKTILEFESFVLCAIFKTKCAILILKACSNKTYLLLKIKNYHIFI